MTENKNVILSARDIVVEFDVRDRVLTAIRVLTFAPAFVEKQFKN